MILTFIDPSVTQEGVLAKFKIAFQDVIIIWTSQTVATINYVAPVTISVWAELQFTPICRNGAFRLWF